MKIFRILTYKVAYNCVFLNKLTCLLKYHVNQFELILKIESFLFTKL